jgi:hypothetical protein
MLLNGFVIVIIARVCRIGHVIDFDSIIKDLHIKKGTS